MSIRTLVEINHDYLYNWETKPEEAAKVLRLALLGDPHGTYRTEIYGIRVILQRHHADEVTVKVT